jgi:hypothetical protein
VNPFEWYLIGAAIIGSGSYFAGYQGGRTAHDREARRQRHHRDRLSLARSADRRSGVDDTVTTRGLADIPGRPFNRMALADVDHRVVGFWRPEDGGQPTAEQRMRAQEANAHYRYPPDGGAV